MINLYERKSYLSAKYDAQANLEGRTHYVDDATLRFHKCRILETRVHDDGLLYSIITSDALDMYNTRRGFRYVIFDIFGNVLARPDLEDSFKTSLKARKAMYDVLNGIDAKKTTLEGLEERKKQHARDIEDIQRMIERKIA